MIELRPWFRVSTQICRQSRRQSKEGRKDSRNQVLQVNEIWPKIRAPVFTVSLLEKDSEAAEGHELRFLVLP